MADYYYEARKHDKWLRRHAKENKARKERMKEFQRAHSRDHQQSLIIEGKPCKLYRDAAASSVEATLMPWNGRHDVLIDRFDARAILDMVPLSPQDTGDHREKKGLETFLSFERYRGILDAQRAGLGEREHTSAVAEQVNEKLAEIARIQQGEPDAAELLAAQQAQNERNKKAETKAAMKEAMNAGVHGHYGPGGTGSGAASSRGGRGAEVPLKYGGDVVGKPKGSREEPDEDEAQLDPEILALIEKEVGGAPAVGDSDDDSSEGSDYSEEEDDEDDQEDDEGGDVNGDLEGATSATQDRLGEEYGISEKRSGYSYSRLLRYERRHRAQQRAIRAEELETAKKRKKAKKRSDGGGAGGEGGVLDDSLGLEGGGGQRVTGSRSRLGSSFRDSPTYEDFVDPLEARRQKRKESRMVGEGGVGRESSGNGAGRGRQYISSFEVTEKKKGGSDSEGSLLDSDSDDEGGGSSHIALLEGFFPTLAISLKKHLQERERREKELEAQREKDRAAEKERQLEQARRRAAARRRSRSRSRSRSSSRGRSRGYGRRDSRDRGARNSGRRGRSRERFSRSRSRSHGRGRSRDRDRRKAYDRGSTPTSKSSRRDNGSAARSSSSLGDGKGTTSGGGSGSSKQIKTPKAEKKLTPMEMMKLRMRKALDSQIQKDKTAIAKKTNKETKMAQLDRRQQRLDEEQHERLQAKAKRTTVSPSPSRLSMSKSRSRSPPQNSRRSRGSNRSRSRSRSRGRSGSGRRGHSHERDRGDSGNGGGLRGDRRDDSREASSRRLRKRSGFSRSSSRSRSRSHSVPSYRGRDHDDGGRRKGGDEEEHYSGRDGFKKRKRGDNSSYDRHRGR